MNKIRNFFCVFLLGMLMAGCAPPMTESIEIIENNITFEAFLEANNIKEYNTGYMYDEDIRLSKEGVTKLYNEYINKGRGNIAYDYYWTMNEAQELSYSFTSNMAANGLSDAAVRAAFREATEIWMSVSGVRFFEDHNNPLFTVFTFTSTAPEDQYIAASFFPHYSDEYDIRMNLNVLDGLHMYNTYEEMVGLFLHELGHSLGIAHEHSRTDATSGVSWASDYQNGAGTPLGEYDPDSVMDYGNQPYTGLSDGDTATIRHLYGNYPLLNENYLFLPGDYNGDGHEDLLNFQKYPDGSSKILGKYGTPSGLSECSVWKSYSASAYARDLANYYTGDFNGDGKTDLMAFYNYPDGSSKIFGWYGTESGLSGYYQWKSYSATAYTRDLANYYTGDFNGDGKTDLMAFYNHPNGSSKILGWYGAENGLDGYDEWKYYSATHFARDSANYYTGDFNGDGKTDLMAFYKYSDGSSRIFGWYGAENGLDGYAEWKYYSATHFARDSANYYTGDFNGDSKTDLMAFYKYSDGSSRIFGWYGTETGLNGYYQWKSYSASAYARDLADYYTGDFNGDGKTDLMAFYKYSNGNSNIFGWYGTETGLNGYYLWKSYVAASYARDSAAYVTGDFTGNGKTDLLSCYTAPNNSVTFFGWSGTANGLFGYSKW